MPGSDDLAAAKAGRLFPSDLDLVLGLTAAAFEEVRGSHLFITGGTGFVGRWLLETLLWANDRLSLGVRAVILTRDTRAFSSQSPHLAGDPAVDLVQGDVRDFRFPDGQFDIVLHLAAETNVRLDNPAPGVYADVIVGGTARVLEFAKQAGVRTLLFVSSGAASRAPMGPYGEAKRQGEIMVSEAGERLGFRVAIARCFSFVGPYLPLDSGFAVGNFIRDALTVGLISVKGDGTPKRSYLYAADMATWLWSISQFGLADTPYEVGSDEAMSIAELAYLVADSVPNKARVCFEGRADVIGIGSSYIPDIRRSRMDLDLHVNVSPKDAIARTVAWTRIALGLGGGGAPR